MTRIALALALALPATAAAQDVERGRQLALQWCAACHTIDRSATTGASNGVPTFPSLAARTIEQLEAAMNPQHGRMPDFSLSKSQQDDLAAFIRSQRSN